MTIFVMS